MHSDGHSHDDQIRRAQAGDQAAFRRLAESHAEPLCRSALALCRDRQTAEDIAQETLFEAWRSLAKFDGRCQLSTWLYGILRHRFLKHVRRANRHDTLPLPADSEHTSPPRQPEPESHSQRAEDAVRVRQAVDQLPDEHRLVIELRFFAEARLEEIAAALNVPLGTVKSRLHNGLEKLRQQNLSVNLFPATGESSARPQ